MKMICRKDWLGILTVALGCAVGSAQADDVFWSNAGTGAWDVPGNWQGNSIPGFDDRALVNNGGTVQVDGTTSPVPDVESLWLAESAGDSGNFEMTGGEFFALETRFGEGGTASATVSGGTLDVGSNSIFVGGRESTGTGVLTVSGADTIITSGDDFQLGRVGTGTLDLQNGQVEGIFTVVGKFGTGLWNQSGGIFRARGDLEIGDGGRPDQTGIAGPREGTINLSGGVLITDASVAIGNRNGTGTINVDGGFLAATLGGSSTIYVGRGMDWGPGEGGAVELRVTGSDGTVIANGDFLMNDSQVASSSTLVAEITGPDHTTIKAGGDALISNGSLVVELSGYTPVNGDSWVLIEAGADLSDEKQAIDDFITTNEFTPISQPDPSFSGSLFGTFSSTSLPAGFSVDYTSTSVVLNFTQAFDPADLNTDGFVDGLDLGILLGNFDSTAPPSGGELNGTPPVDGLDLGILLGAWNPPALAASQSVPEPTSGVLLLMGVLALSRSSLQGRS